MSLGLFVSGTDTGVGKTVVTAGLAAALRANGMRVGVMKPVESGCLRRDGDIVPLDALFLREAAGCEAPLDLINPYSFEEPLAPALAAERYGTRIDTEHIRACFNQLADENDIVLVEGAGGILAPLTEWHTMLELALILNLPVLLVARNVLGALNHTALTVIAAQHRDVRVLGVVLNHASPHEDLATRTNAEALRRWAGVPLLAEIPYVGDVGHEVLPGIGERLPVEEIVQSLQRLNSGEGF